MTHTLHPPTAPSHDREVHLLLERAWFSYCRRALTESAPVTRYSPPHSFVANGQIILRTPSRTMAVFQLVHRKLRRIEEPDWPAELRNS